MKIKSFKEFYNETKNKILQPNNSKKKRKYKKIQISSKEIIEALLKKEAELFNEKQ